MHFLTLVNLLPSYRTLGVVLRRDLPSVLFLSAVALFESSDKKGDAYNILLTVVFGFATLNILSLVAKRFEPHQNRMTFGEVLAVATVVVSVFLLGWEMLSFLHIFPIKLKR